MEFIEIQKLISAFNQSDIRELEINQQDFHIHLSKNEQPFNQTIAVNEPLKAQGPAQAPAQAEQPTTSDELLIAAPMVGSIYLQPKPGAKCFAEKGSYVNKGDVVCIIEAMKVMTEIKSEICGFVQAILVENEELVEFGQPLFKLTPSL